MITGKTESGFEFTIEDEALDDYELLEALCDVDHGNAGMLPLIVTHLLGEEQKENLKNHIRKENGRVSASKMIEEVIEIFHANDQGKNS